MTIWLSECRTAFLFSRATSRTAMLAGLPGDCRESEQLCCENASNEPDSLLAGLPGDCRESTDLDMENDMKANSKVELLAPAGNKEAFFGAINAGADAVYLAGNRFGARAYAQNFTEEELLECIRYGHLLGKKVYLTVNTLLKERELEELPEYLRPMYEEGLDAVIIQDFGVLCLLRECFPKLQLHVSTQMSLCSSYGAELLKSMGASRIVPARELSLRELREIRNRVDIELETFIHGAMCYCYSGQCLFSSILGGRSGNRGRCAQPCRLPYSADGCGTAEKKNGTSGRESYYLSMKDLCSVEHLPALISSGIDSFKIEGRMKKPEYVAGVTAIYRKYIDLYYALEERYRDEAAKRYQVARSDLETLNELYVRSETQDGYYFRRNGKEMITLKAPGYSGSDEALLDDIRSLYLKEKKKLPIDFEASFEKGQPAVLKLAHYDTSVIIYGQTVEEAKSQPITEENIRRQLTRLGDGAFAVENMKIAVDEQIFYPLKQLNELRRQAVEALERQLLRRNGYENAQFVAKIPFFLKENSKNAGNRSESAPATPLSDAGKNGWTVSVNTLAQLKALGNWCGRSNAPEPDVIYVPGDLILKDPGAVTDVCRLFRHSRFLVSLPYVFRHEDQDFMDRINDLITEQKGMFSGVLVRSVDELGYFAMENGTCLIHLDANVYVWNSVAAKLLATWSDRLCLPYELKASEQRQLLQNGKGNVYEKIVYGRIPMMITANCLFRTVSDHCGAESRRTGQMRKPVLTDRYGKKFPVVPDCAHCMNIIYNSVPLSLHGEYEKWTERVNLRIDFTLESDREMTSILNAFLLGDDLRLPEYTTGHEKRGVE